MRGRLQRNSTLQRVTKKQNLSNKQIVPNRNSIQTSQRSDTRNRKCVSNQKWGADRKIILRLYKTLIKSKLEYGYEAYGSACKTLLQSLEPVQNAALRLALGAYRTSPISSLHCEAEIKPTEYYREGKALNYYIRICANEDKTMLETLSKIDYAKYDRNPKLARPYMYRVRSINEKYNMNLQDIAVETREGPPPWAGNKVIECRELYGYKKNNGEDIMRLKHAYLEHTETHVQSDRYFTDGSKTPQGVGYAVLHGGDVEARRVQKYASVYTAEVQAILGAVKMAKQSESRRITIVTDSRSAIAGVLKYNNQHPIIRKIQTEMAVSEKSFRLCWVPSHIGIRHNEKVDTAARRAIDQLQVTDIKIPRGDYKAYVKKQAKAQWAERWNGEMQNNKLRRIRDSTRTWKSSYQEKSNVGGAQSV